MCCTPAIGIRCHNGRAGCWNLYTLQCTDWRTRSRCQPPLFSFHCGMIFESYLRITAAFSTPLHTNPFEYMKCHWYSLFSLSNCHEESVSQYKVLRAWQIIKWHTIARTDFSRNRQQKSNGIFPSHTDPWSFKRAEGLLTICSCVRI